MKRFNFLFLIFLVLSVCFPANNFGTTNKLNIAMILWRGETNAEKGFKDALNKLGYQVDYTIFNAKQDKAELGKIVRNKIPFDQYDYIYSFGTTVTKVVQQAMVERVPHIFNIVADPVGAGIVKELNEPGSNISGVSNQVPLELQIKNAHKAFAFKKLGVFFNPREKNSMLIKEKLTQIAQQMNFEVIPLRSPPAGELLEENLKRIVDTSIDVDAVYLPTDSFLVSKAEYIGQQLKKGKIVSIGAIKKYIQKGVMLGTVTDYHTLGTMAASIVDRHQKGTSLSQIPVGVQKDPVLLLNKTTADLLKIKINPELMKTAVIVK